SWLFTGLVALVLGSSIIAGPVVYVQVGSSAVGLEKLRDGLENGVWAAYAPTEFNPNLSPPIIPSADSIRADLAALRQAGFDGIVTNGADVPSIPPIAEQTGMRWVLLGIWDPGNPDEIRRTKEAARSDRVLGVIVGKFRRDSLDPKFQAAPNAFQ